MTEKEKKSGKATALKPHVLFPPVPQWRGSQHVARTPNGCREGESRTENVTSPTYSIAIHQGRKVVFIVSAGFQDTKEETCLLVAELIRTVDLSQIAAEAL